MKAFVNGKPVDPQALPVGEQQQVICFCAPEETAAALERLCIDPAQQAELAAHASTHYESQNGYDYMNVNLPDFTDPEAEHQRAQVFFSGPAVLFVSAGVGAACQLEQELDARSEEFPTPARAVYQFFNLLVRSHGGVMEAIEEEIADLEEKILQKKQVEDCTAEISAQRRKILTLKRYFEGLVDLHEDLEENQNGLFKKDELRSFRLQTNRADRFYHGALTLAEYITQVREAYQNQLDISLNETMKVFTVITAIFLPLTLIAGWYGMNLIMPEYNSLYAYPAVIAVSAAIAIGLIWYFKRNKWF